MNLTLTYFDPTYRFWPIKRTLPYKQRFISLLQATIQFFSFERSYKFTNTLTWISELLEGPDKR